MYVMYFKYMLKQNTLVGSFNTYISNPTYNRSKLFVENYKESLFLTVKEELLLIDMNISFDSIEANLHVKY
jgi:hypothetical protein